MSDKAKTESATEEPVTMQESTTPVQDSEVMGVGLATELIAELKKERDDLQENLDICAGLVDRYMYRQGIIECTLKLKDERLLRCAYAYMSKLSKGEA